MGAAAGARDGSASRFGPGERAHTELAASGAKPRRAYVTGPGALTPSEQRVARLAAEGHTSKQIAQALFVTTRTVDTHLGHAYTKLGIDGRAQLGAAPAKDREQPPTARGRGPGGPPAAR